MDGRRDPRRVGAASALLGLALVLTLMLSMNRQLARPDQGDGEAFSSIDLVRKEKPKPPEVVARREPPMRRPARSAPAPLLGLDSGLAGSSFGLPGLDAGELDLGAGLLGDAAASVMTDDSVDVAPRPLVQTPMA